MDYLDEILNYAIDGIEDDKSIYTKDKLVKALNNIIRPNIDRKSVV